jgi:hypothetical protein
VSFFRFSAFSENQSANYFPETSGISINPLTLGFFKMINISDIKADIKKLDAASRHKAADAISAWAETASVEEKRALVAALTTKISEIDAAQAAIERKKVALARISATRESLAGKNMIDALQGTLRRAGVASLESLCDKSLFETDQIFAASKLTTTEKMTAKSTLHRLGVLAK